MRSPSEKLATLIAERLVREKVMSRAEAAKILSKLAEGKLTEADWRNAILAGTPRKSRP
jgi:hypothetical protein